MSQHKSGKKQKIIEKSQDNPFAGKIELFLPKDQRKFLFVIIAAGFILRLLFIIETQNSPFIQHLFSDSKIYNDWAKEIVSSGNWFGSNVFFMSPFYPYFIAVFYKIFGESVLLIRIIQVLISSINIFIIYLIGRELFNKTIGYAAAVIAAFYSMFIFYSGLLLSETIQIFTVSVLVYYLITTIQKKLEKDWFWVGLLLGICAIIRANILLFILFLIAWFVFKIYSKEYQGNYIKKSLIFLILGTSIPIIPVTLNNYLAANDFVLITSNGGINFYLGNNSNSQGVFSAPAEFDFYNDMSGQKYAEKILNKKLKPSEASSYWYDRGFTFIEDKPFKAVELFLTKVFLFFGSGDNPQSSVMDKGFYKDNYSKILQLPLFGFAFISYLAIPGLILSGEDKKKLMIIYLFILSYTIATVIFFVNGRYRLALTPLLIVFAAFTILKIYDFFRSRSVNKLIRPGLLILSFILVYTFIIPKPEFNNYDAYQNLGIIEYGEKDYNKAIMDYNKSLALRDNYLTYVDLGNAYAAKKDYRSALAAYQKSINRNPGYTLAYFNIGLVHSETGNYPLAAKAYLKAIELDPAFAEAVRNLAIVYYIKENYTESLKYFEKYLMLSRDEAAKSSVRKDIENIKSKLNK